MAEPSHVQRTTLSFSHPMETLCRDKASPDPLAGELLFNGTQSLDKRNLGGMKILT